jgi:2',3'-cyclic-nucleotide 2'-phosphodiesterase (5'-nucleotidase family)
LIPADILAGDVAELTILHMNDIHGHYLPRKVEGYPEPVGGLARAETLIRRITAENRATGRETLILFAGDLLTGTPFSMVFKGELGVKLMNRIGFRTMTVGNHEFDQGLGNLVSRLKPSAAFPIMSANIYYAGDKPNGHVFETSIMKPVAGSGPPMLILALTTEETPTSTNPKNVEGLRFADPVRTAKEMLKSVSEDCLVIAVTHLGVTGDEKLARSCPKIDVIVGGHSHTALFEPIKTGNAVIVQAGAYAEYLGRLDLEVEDGRVIKSRGKLIPLTSEIPEDREVASVIEQYQAKMDSRLRDVIGRTDVLLGGSMRKVRSDENTNLGELIAYLAAKNVHAQTGLINGGSIRASIHKGDVTLADVYTVLPFGNHPVKVELTGDDLLRVLQRSADLDSWSGGKLQTFGLSRRIEKGRVIIDKVRGEEFDRGKTYSVAINDFLMAGGDGYTLFRKEGRNIRDGRSPISDLLIDLIKDKKVLTAGFLEGIAAQARRNDASR